MIMLFEYLLLDDLFILFKGVQEIESDGTVRVVIPNLYKVYPCTIMKERLVHIETLLFLLYHLPVSRIETQITSRTHVRVHSFQCYQHVLI